MKRTLAVLLLLASPAYAASPPPTPAQIAASNKQKDAVIANLEAALANKQKDVQIAVLKKQLKDQAAAAPEAEPKCNLPDKIELPAIDANDMWALAFAPELTPPASKKDWDSMVAAEKQRIRSEIDAHCKAPKTK